MKRTKLSRLSTGSLSSLVGDLDITNGEVKVDDTNCDDDNDNDNDDNANCCASTLQSIPSSCQHQQKQQQQRRRKVVSFTNIYIRSYKRSLCDHPAVSSGPGIAIDWDYDPKEQIYTVDDYERTAMFSRRTTKVDLVLSRMDRESILREECGYGRSEIAKCVRSVVAMKNKRRQTLNNMEAQKIEERFQNFKRRMSRLIGKRKASKKEIQLLWKKAAAEAGGSSSSDGNSSHNSGSRRGSGSRNGRTRSNTNNRGTSLDGECNPNSCSGSENSSLKSIIKSVSVSSQSKSEARDKIGPMEAPAMIAVDTKQQHIRGGIDDSESSLGSGTADMSGSTFSVDDGFPKGKEPVLLPPPSAVSDPQSVLPPPPLPPPVQQKINIVEEEDDDIPLPEYERPERPRQ